MCDMCVHVQQNQKRVLDLPELELQVVSCLVWVSRGELGSFARAQSALIHGAVSLTFTCQFSDQ